MCGGGATTAGRRRTSNLLSLALEYQTTPLWLNSSFPSAVVGPDKYTLLTTKDIVIISSRILGGLTTDHRRPPVAFSVLVSSFPTLIIREAFPSRVYVSPKEFIV